MDPINYSIDVPNPTQSFMQGMQSGVAVNQIQQQQAAQQAAQARQQKMNADLAALAKNPTTEGIIQASITYPELTEAHKRTFDMLAPQEQEAKVNTMIPIYAAMKKGRMDIASNMLNEQADALQNSGKTQEAAQTRAHAQAALDHPEILDLQSSLLLSQAMGADKYKALNDSLIAQQKAPSEVAQSQAEATLKGAQAKAEPQTIALKNADISSQIKNRSDVLKLDYAKVQQERDLKLAEMNQKLLTPSETAQKVINDAASTAVVSDQAATKYLDLAKRLEEADPNSFAGGLNEGVKKITGGQDDITALRKEYDRLRSSGIAQMYKGLGSMSDSDVKIAMGAFLPDTADTKQLVKFVRGMAKMNQLDSVTQDAKSEWVGAVGHMGTAKKQLNIAGYDVPAGTSFTQFANKYAQKKADEILSGKSPDVTSKRSYMNTTNAQPSSDIPTAPLSNGWSITPIGGK